MRDEYELIIVGGGAAGFAAAMKANELGVKALMVNDNVIGLGGTCVNVGCVPTKYLLNITRLIHSSNHYHTEGLQIKTSLNFESLIEEKNRLIDKLRERKYVDVLKGMSKVNLIEGNARFISKNEIEVGGKRFRAKKFVVATGSSTFVLPIEGLNKVGYLTHIQALSLKKLPESMIILGGGALGVEFAQIFARLGTKVCLLQTADRILKREEPELAHLLQEYLEEEGIKIFTSVFTKSVKQDGEERLITADVNGKIKTYRAKELFLATGRKPNTNGMGIENTGVRLGEKGEIIVNDEMQAEENIFAAGDVTGEPMLETVAAREGMIAVHNAFSKPKRKMDYTIIPHAVFTDPQLAGVGLTDEEAVKKGIKCQCSTISMELVPKAQVVKETKGKVKMVVDRKTKRILGVHILSTSAADLIHEAVMVVKNKMIVDEVINTLHVFPTLSEAIKIVAQSFVRDISKMSCCVE